MRGGLHARKGVGDRQIIEHAARAELAPAGETGKIGADNPDNLYLMGRLSGRNEGLFTICATVQDKTGCLTGTVTP